MNQSNKKGAKDVTVADNECSIVVFFPGRQMSGKDHSRIKIKEEQLMEAEAHMCGTTPDGST